MAVDLGNDPHVGGFAVGAGEVIGHRRAGVEERDRDPVGMGTAFGEHLPLSGDGVVRGAAAEEGNAPDDVADALEEKLLFARRRHEMKVIRCLVASGGPHCLARHFGAGAAGAAALGQAGDADAQLGVGEGEQGDEAALAADEAFRGDDPGERGVPDQGYARQFFADALKDSIHVVVGAGVDERHLDAAQPDLRFGRRFPPGEVGIGVGA